MEIKSNQNTKDQLNMYDYFGFPDRSQRNELKQIVDINKIRLIKIKDKDLIFVDIILEQLNAWITHINNFSSHLGLHFLLLYYHYAQGPSDTIEIENYHNSITIHKIYFDTFAEDTALYLISYFDKHLEMFNDIYNLQRQSGKSHKLSRKQIINEMKKVKILGIIAEEYQKVLEQIEFVYIKAIRDNFVHNKSSSHFGMNVDKKETTSGIVYGCFNSKGFSTEETYIKLCSLLKIYSELCEKVNIFIDSLIKDTCQS